MKKQNGDILLMLALLWWIWPRPKVTTSISFPQLPPGTDNTGPVYYVDDQVNTVVNDQGGPFGPPAY